MNEIIRLLVIVGAVAVALICAGLWAVYRTRSMRSSVNTESLSPWPAVVVFTSTDCDACDPVRHAVLRRVPAGVVREVAYQGNAELFRSAGIDKVPSVVVIDGQGNPVGVFEGQVTSRRIGSAVRRARLE